MADKFGPETSPSQLRAADVVINWASSPSPFGCEGLLSMEMGSPFQLFSPITFGTVDIEQHDATSVFSPSMFSPSKSKFNVTSRLLKKREICTSSSNQSDKYMSDGTYRAPTLQFDNVLSSSVLGKVDNFPQLSSSYQPFKRASYSASSSSLRSEVDVKAASACVGDDQLRVGVVDNSEHRSVFFSPDMNAKPQTSANQHPLCVTKKQGPGIAEVEKLGKDDKKPPERQYLSDSIPPVARKLNRSASIDQRVLNSVGNIKIENQFPSSGAAKTSFEISKNVLSSGGAVSRSAYASPSVTNLRDDTQKGYADSVMVTPSQCKCKKTKCLKLYCDCFALLRFCGPNCGCTECHNDTTHEEIRKVAILATMQRTATAFTSKVTPTSSHVAGCNCSKSNCLKKYCECFLGGAVCGVSCKCQSCKNFTGSEALSAVRKPEYSLPQPLSNLKAAKDHASKFKYSNRSFEGEQPMTIQFVQPDSDVKSSSQSSPPMDMSQGSKSDDDVTKMDSLDTSTASHWDVYIDKFEQIGSSDRKDGTRKEGTEVDTAKLAGSETAERRPSRPTQGGKEAPFSGPQSLQPMADFFTSITPDASSSAFHTMSNRVKGCSDDRRDGLSGSKSQLWSTSSSLASAPSISSSMPCPNFDITPSSSSKMTKTKADALESTSSQPMKKRKMNETRIVYPYFGPSVPEAPKICALRCLEFLDGKDFYSVSVLNHLWSKTAMDSALWE